MKNNKIHILKTESGKIYELAHNIDLNQGSELPNLRMSPSESRNKINVI